MARKRSLYLDNRNQVESVEDIEKELINSERSELEAVSVLRGEERFGNVSERK